MNMAKKEYLSTELCWYLQEKWLSDDINCEWNPIYTYPDWDTWFYKKIKVLDIKWAEKLICKLLDIQIVEKN
jgi:hypothetical protein